MKIAYIIAAFTSALLISQPAFGLSCMRPDLVRTLNEAKASDKYYHIFVGRFDAGPLPLDSDMRTKDRPNVPYVDSFKHSGKKVRAGFTGYSLGKYRYQDAQLTRFPVDIETSCAGHWCGNVPSPKQEIIAFVEVRDGQPPVLHIGACPGWTYQASNEKVQKLRDCLDNRPTPGNLKVLGV